MQGVELAPGCVSDADAVVDEEWGMSESDEERSSILRIFFTISARFSL